MSRSKTTLSSVDIVPRSTGRGETKIATLNSLGASISTAGTYVALTSNVATGADVNNRIGRRIRVKRVGFQGTLVGGQTNSVADDPYNAFRMVVVLCTPGFTFSGGVSVNQWIDPRYHAGLFAILFDKTIILRTNAKDSTGYIPASKLMFFNLKMDQMLEYASSAASAPVGKELRLYMVSDSTAVVHPGLSTDSTVVLEFSDTN